MMIYLATPIYLKAASGCQKSTQNYAVLCSSKEALKLPRTREVEHLNSHAK